LRDAQNRVLLKSQRNTTQTTHAQDRNPDERRYPIQRQLAVRKHGSLF
jgi:hypothetical protein